MSDSNSSLTIRVGMTGASAIVSEMNRITSAALSAGKTLVAAFGIGFSVSELARMTSQAINAAEALGRLSKETAFSIGTLDALRRQANQNGISFDALQSSLTLFTARMEDARLKGGAAMDVFRNVGQDVALMVAQGRPAEQVYAAIAQKFHDGALAGREAAIAHDLFGRSFKEFIPLLQEGGDGLERMKALGGGITQAAVGQATDFNKSLRDLKEQIDEVFRTVATNILPTLQNMTASLHTVTTDTNTLSGVATGLTDVFKGVVTVGAVLGAVFDDIGKSIGYGANVIEVNAVTAFETLKRIMLDVIELGKQTATTFIDLASTVLDSEEVIKNAATGHFGTARDIISGDLAQIKKDVQAIGNTALDIPATVGGAVQKVISNGMADWGRFLGDLKAQWTAVSAFLGGMWGGAPASPKAPAVGAASAPGAGSAVTPGYVSPDTRMKEIAFLDEKAKLQAKIIQSDPYLSQAEKAGELLPILARENDLLNEQIAIQNSIVKDPTRTLDEQAKAKLEIVRLEGQQNDLLRERQKLEQQTSFGASFSATVTELQNQWGTWATETAGLFKSVFNDAIHSISNGIAALIMGTKTWAQALLQIGSNILNNIVSAIVEMGVRWIVTQMMMFTVGKSLQSAATAALIPIAASQALIWWTPAVLSTIASAGTTAALAPTEVGSAVLAGFKEGGFTGIGERDELAGVVHRGEFVMPADTVNRYGVDAMESIRSGGVAAQASPGKAAVNTNVQIATFGGEADAKRWADSQEGEVWFLNMMNRHASRYSRRT